jgi:hypothetical protein
LNCAARCGPVHPASPLSVCLRCSVSQCARRWCAPHRCWGVTSPVLRKCWSVRWCADMASARWRIVLDQPSPAARPGSRVFVAVVAHARYGHPLRFYITPHCPQCPPVAALKLRLVPVTASRPSGEGNRRYAKWPSLESVAQPSALPGRCTPYAPPSARPCGCRGTCGIGQALRAVCLVSGLRPVILCVPRPPCGLAAARHWPCAGLPVRPQGAPSAQRKGARRLTAAGRQPHFCGANPCNDALVLRPLRGRLLGNELT